MALCSLSICGGEFDRLNCLFGFVGITELLSNSYIIGCMCVCVRVCPEMVGNEGDLINLRYEQRLKKMFARPI